MAACRVVEAFNVFDYVQKSGLSVSIDALLDMFFLQAAEKGFCHRVVPAVSSSAHAWFEIVIFAEAPPSVAPALSSLIRMDQRLVGRRLPTAFIRASRTNSRWIVGLVAQSTIFREKRSMTMARYSQPCQVRMYVISVTHALFGRATVN
jgi:hypothetical protein